MIWSLGQVSVNDQESSAVGNGGSGFIWARPWGRSNNTAKTIESQHDARLIWHDVLIDFAFPYEPKPSHPGSSSNEILCLLNKSHISHTDCGVK
jgi:hypothetical protein